MLDLPSKSPTPLAYTFGTLSSRLFSGFRSSVLFEEIGLRNLKAEVRMKGGEIEERWRCCGRS